MASDDHCEGGSQTPEEVLRMNAGAKVCRRVRSTGTIVTVYSAEEADLCAEGGPWVIVCETHGGTVGAETRRDAERSMPWPADFCERCRENEDERKDR